MQLQHSELIKVTLYWAKQFLALANVRYLFCTTAWSLALCGTPKEASQHWMYWSWTASGFFRDSDVQVWCYVSCARWEAGRSRESFLEACGGGEFRQVRNPSIFTTSLSYSATVFCPDLCFCLLICILSRGQGNNTLLLFVFECVTDIQKAHNVGS